MSLIALFDRGFINELARFDNSDASDRSYYPAVVAMQLNVSLGESAHICGTQRIDATPRETPQ